MTNRLTQFFFHATLMISIFALPAVSGEKASLSTHGELTIDGSMFTNSDAPFDSVRRSSGRTMLTLDVKTTQLANAKVETLVDFYRLYGLYADLAAQTLQGNLPVPAGNSPFYADLRMLYGALYLPWADITVGRQIVNFGKGMLFSPLDCFSTVDVTELSLRRSGSDIAMAAIPFGTVTGLDLITTLPQTGTGRTTAARAFTTISGWDVGFTALHRADSKTTITGIAFKGDLIAGVTGELVTRYDAEHDRTDGEAMAGIDYSISRTWFFNAEYYYRTDPAAHILYRTHNVFGSLRYMINDLMNLSLVCIATVPVENKLVTLQFGWNILQDVTSTAFVRYGSYDASLPLSIPDTECGVRVVIAF